MNMEGKIAHAAEAINDAGALLITAGAGMGVDSGLPDFRGTEGFWRAYPVIAKLGLRFEEIANPAWFETSPELAWAFYGHRLNLYRKALPHSGFQQLFELATQKRMDYFVVTSNVDGLFQKAGFDQARIVECHGSIHHFQCTAPCRDEIWDADNEQILVDEATFRAGVPLPKCLSCGALARPNVLMFGDGSWIAYRTKRQEELFNRWFSNVCKSRAKLVVVELGAGTSIPTVRHTSECVVRETDATLIRINVREAQVPKGHIGLNLGAAEGVARICEQLRLFSR
jgi:NAD-dependent SIR2 family protein deacetylase